MPNNNINKHSIKLTKRPDNKKPNLILTSCLILSSCGGGGGSNSDSTTGSDTNATTSPSISLSHIESALSRSSTLNGNSPDGIWLLAQERDYSYTMNNSQTNDSDNGTATVMRTDIISLQKNGSVLQIYYCSNYNRLAFEADLISTSQITLTGDGFYFPSKAIYTGTFVGDGTTIEFSPNYFSDETDSGNTLSLRNGDITLRAYKLRDGISNTAMGTWQRGSSRETIQCGTYREETFSGQQIENGVASNYQTSQKHLSFDTGNTQVYLWEVFQNNSFSNIQITEVNDSKTVLSEESQASYQLNTLSPLEYQGDYELNAETNTASFTIDLTE